MDDKKLPKWTPATRTDDRGLRISANAVTVNQRDLRPQRIVAKWRDQVDGTVKEASVPYPKYERWIDPAGNVVPLVVHSNRLIVTDDAYQAKIRNRKRRAGWLPYDSVPDGMGMTMGQWELARVEEVARRQHLHTAREDAFGKAWKSRDEQLANKTAEQLANAVRAMGVEIAAAVSGGVRPARAKAEKPE